MANFNKPVRMCVLCRDRIVQNDLLRLQCIDKKLVPFTGNGRSFYICCECIKKIDDDKESSKIEKRFYHICKNKSNYLFQLKEILVDVRHS